MDVNEMKDELLWKAAWLQKAKRAQLLNPKAHIYLKFCCVHLYGKNIWFGGKLTLIILIFI